VHELFYNLYPVLQTHDLDLGSNLKLKAKSHCKQTEEFLINNAELHPKIIIV